MKFPPASLRSKITLGYYLIATLFILLVVFTFFELRLFEKNIEAGEHIADFFDATLEIRRFEKNYFLYHQELDYHENQQYLAQAAGLLQEHATLFHALPGAPPSVGLAGELARYAALMRQYRESRDAVLAVRIREVGKWLVEGGEQLARSQRAVQRESLARQRQVLLISTVLLIGAVLGLGQWLSWRVSHPLRQREAGM
jgi:hypothetical protein